MSKIAAKPDTSEFVSLKQAAETLSLSWQTVRRMLNDGRLQGKRFGRVFRVSKESLDRLCDLTAA